MSAQRGDTLIEVLLTIALLAIASVTLHAVMNRGMADMQTALERTNVRAGMNGQINMLRAMRDDYMAQNADPGPGTMGELWANVITPESSGGRLNVGPTPTFDETTCNRSGVAFYVTPDTLTGLTLNTFNNTLSTTYAKPGEGMWVEAYQRGVATPRAVDLLVRGCWQTIGTATLMQETTTVRLYDGQP